MIKKEKWDEIILNFSEFLFFAKIIQRALIRLSVKGLNKHAFR